MFFHQQKEKKERDRILRKFSSSLPFPFDQRKLISSSQNRNFYHSILFSSLFFSPIPSPNNRKAIGRCRLLPHWIKRRPPRTNRAPRPDSQTSVEYDGASISASCRALLLLPSLISAGSLQILGEGWVVFSSSFSLDLRILCWNCARNVNGLSANVYCLSSFLVYYIQLKKTHLV